MAKGSMTPGPEERGGSQFLVMQFNMWGWKGFQGAVDISLKAADVIRARLPLVISLNEVCQNQARALAVYLDGWALGYQWHHDATTHVKNQTNECAFGNAIFWRGPHPGVREPEIALPLASEQELHDLGRTKQIESRKLLAVKTEILNIPTVLCTTHLTAGSEPPLVKVRTRQIQAVAALVSDWQKHGQEVLLCGDFNEEPDSSRMDPIYDPLYGATAHGLCREATGLAPAIRHRPFQGTTESGKKFDYIFTTGGFAPISSEIGPPKTDHHAYFGRMDT